MKNYKKILSIAICLLLTFVIYSYICMIVIPKSPSDTGGTRFYGGTGFMAEPNNSIDVVFYGNSDVYSGITPATLFEKYGYTSYASGTALQSINKINNLLDKTFETQSPKVAILEVDCLYNPSPYDFDTNNFFVSPFVFHTRWKELTKDDFYTIPRRENKYDIAKGHIFSNDVYETMHNNYMGNKNAKPHSISDKTYNNVMAFIKKCREQNTEVIFLELPSVTSWTYAKHNYITKLAKENNIPFIDLNVEQDNYKVDFKNDFRDNGNHLNTLGAAKVTEYIGEYLSDNYSYILTDKRNDKNYDFWFDVVEHFKSEKLKLQ